MKKFLLAAVACVAIATPALARDGAGYVGVEGGILFPRTTDFKSGGDTILSLHYKRGLDIDAIAGFDLGMFRVEGELGYKRTKIKYFSVDGDTATPADLDVSDRASVLSGMVNGLVDLSLAPGASFYAGGGVGRARVKAIEGHDSAWAWQLIAGARTAVSPNIDLGLKYRYFQTGKLGSDFDGEFDAVYGKFKSHSLLASLIFNFGGVAPPPPPPPVVEVAPPPPPPPPATQTCPDGSVIDATAVCPVAPPPPPPPPPAKGERG